MTCKMECRLCRHRLRRDGRETLRVASGEHRGSVSGFSRSNCTFLPRLRAKKKLPGSGGASLFYKNMPRTGSSGCDIAYTTTSQPVPGTAGDTSRIKFSDANFRQWRGRAAWSSGTVPPFEQSRTTSHVVNGLAELEILEYLGAETIESSAPSIAVMTNVIRPRGISDLNVYVCARRRAGVVAGHRAETVRSRPAPSLCCTVCCTSASLAERAHPGSYRAP